MDQMKRSSDEGLSGMSQACSVLKRAPATGGRSQKQQDEDPTLAAMKFVMGSIERDCEGVIKACYGERNDHRVAVT